MIKVRNFLTQNILWKLISLILAIILWVIAINVQDPWTNKTFGTELEIRNLELLKDNDLILLNKEQLLNRNINVRVRARRSGLSNISQDRVHAYIDISDINIYKQELTNASFNAEVNLNVNTILSRNEYEVNARPATVPVVLDRITTREIPVVVNTVNPSGPSYVSLTPTINPSTLLVTGPQSLIEDIGEIVAVIDLQGATDNVIEFVTPVIYNHNRRDITEKFNLNVSEVEVSVPIHVYRKIPVNPPNIIGSLAPELNIIGVDYTPHKIEVIGSVQDINKINSLDIGNIDVTGATSDMSVVVDMESKLRGSNLRIRSGTPSSVAVTVNISDGFVINISVPITMFNIEGDTTNLELESHVNISLMGERLLLESLGYRDIMGTIDVSNLEPGEHNVAIDIILPEGVTSIGGDILTRVIVYYEDEQENNNGILLEEDEEIYLLEDEQPEDTQD